MSFVIPGTTTPPFVIPSIGGACFLCVALLLTSILSPLAPSHREALLDPERGYRGHRAEGLDFYIEHVSWKRLPRDVFAPFGGFEAAKALRQERGYGVKKAKEVETAAVTGADGEDCLGACYLLVSARRGCLCSAMCAG